MAILLRRSVISECIWREFNRATDALGKRMRAGGSTGAEWSASSVLRLIRCLITERRAVFLGIITAYPIAFSGIIAVKCVENTRRPVERAVGKSLRDSLFLRGNTAFMESDSCGRHGDAF